MGVEKLNAFRVVFEPTDKKEVKQVSIILLSDNVEDAVIKARDELKFKREDWRVFRAGPEMMK